MNVRKRGLALLMCICMIFTLLPFSAFADASSDDSVVYGQYDNNGKWKQVANAKDTVTYPVDNQGNTVTLKKTATPTGNKNEYKIDLEVITTETSSTKAGDAATVLVIDVSSSMKRCAECGREVDVPKAHKYLYDHAFESRIAAAQTAAKQFIDAFKSDSAKRYVSVVRFSDNASVACDWQDVSTQAGYNAVKTAIEGLSAGGGTNLDAGLQTANTQLSKTTVESIKANAKNVIALTDGMPTYYQDASGSVRNHGSYGCLDTNKATAESATALKASASVYTVCFGASEDKCWEKGSAHKWDDWGFASEWHETDGPTVGDFLKNSIATQATNDKTYAYNADNTKALLKAFKDITDTITEGISAGTVKDGLPTGVSFVGDAPTAFVENADGTYSWELIPANAKQGTVDGRTTYTYKVSYVVTLDTSDPEFNEDIYHALNTETTFTAGGEVYKFNVPGVKGTAPRYTVTYQPGDHGTLTGADNNGNVVTSGLKNGDPTPAAPDVNPHYGYYHIGWEPVIVDTVNGSATYTARYEKLNNLSYTIKHYWIGDKTQTIREDIVKSDATLGDTITVEVDNAAHIDGYTIMPEQSENSTTITEDSNKVINLYYYKNVTVEAKNYEKAAGTADPTFEATVTGVVGTDNINYTITRPDGETAGSYTLTPSGNNIQGNYYVVEWKPGTLTIYDTYTVTYKYEYTDGTPVPETVLAAPVDSKSPYRAGSPVTVLNAPAATLDGYIFDGWYIGAIKMDGKSFEIMSDTVIIGKWKPVTGLTCTINYIWNGNKTTPIRTDTIDGLTYNEVVTKFPMDIPGYTPVSNNSQEIIVKTTGNVINFYYYKNVTLESKSGKFTYNGKDHSVSGYDVITKADNGKDVKVDAEFIGVSASRTEKDVGSYPVTFKFKGNLVDKEGLIGKIDSNLYYIVSDVKEGTLTIEKIKDEVTVKITGNTKTVTYNGKEHNVTGYATDVGDKPITVALNDGKVAEAKGTDVGTYYMQLTAADFVVTSDIYANIKVIVEDGWLKINRRPMPPVNPPITDKITVEITGNSDSVVYDGTEHSVKDYTVKISDSRYTEKDFTFSGKALASGVNAGTYEMGLKADQFKNTNARFTNVEFIIKADGVLTITQRPLTITAGSAEGIAPVTCDKYTVEGLATGDKVDSVKITGIQSEPGESPNVASDAVIKNAKGEDVTANYKITYVDGVLKAIEVLNKEIHFNYVIGYTDGTIRPNNDISRAEVATIFFRLLTDEAREQYTTTAGNFTDVKAGMWCNRAIATLTNMGIIKGYTDGSFQPNKSITRAELATIIARFAKLDVNTKTFSDINGHWAQKNIELAAGNGWINGYEDGTFRPNNNITRAETFAMINRVLDRQTESVSDLLPTSEMNMWSDNMNENAWYYKDVQEATNYHKCDRVGDSVYEKWTEKVPDIDWASYQI